MVDKGMLATAGLPNLVIEYSGLEPPKEAQYLIRKTRLGGLYRINVSQYWHKTMHYINNATSMTQHINQS